MKGGKFNPDYIIPAIQDFFYGDFKKWCELISLKEFWGLEDLLRQVDTDSRSLAIIKTAYTKFQNLTTQLREYVTTEVEVLSEEAREMLFSELFSLKHQLDSISSEGHVNNLLQRINENALKYYDGEHEEIVTEYTGEVITKKVFSKKVAYAYPENYYVYHLYLRVALRDLRLLLDGYYRNFKVLKLSQEDIESIVKQTPIKEALKEELYKYKRGLLKKKAPLSYALYGRPEKWSERTKWLSELHDKLLDKGFITRLAVEKIKSREKFIDVFIADSTVYTKIPWHTSNAALKEFIERIFIYLNDDSRIQPFAIAEKCFSKDGDSKYKYTSDKIRNHRSKISKADKEALDDIFRSLPKIDMNPKGASISQA